MESSYGSMRARDWDEAADECDNVIVSSVVRELPSLNLVNIKKERWYASINVEGTVLRFKLDTGSDVNFIPCDIFDKMNLNVKSKPLITFRAYGGVVYKPKAIVELKIYHNGQELTDEFWITDVSKQPILGLTACVQLGLLKRCTPCIDSVLCKNTHDLVEKHRMVFEGVGKFNKQCHLSLKPDAVPVQHPPRRIALALKEKLKTKLQEMEKLQIISRVDIPKGWVHHITIVEKPNGEI